jgi:transcriptional regulator with XRE-family HTH domain
MHKDLTYLHRIVRLEILCAKYKRIEVEYRPTGKSWIEYIRKGLRMNQAQLGRLAGVSKQAVSKLEAREGTDELSFKTLNKLDGAMDMEVVYGLVPKEGTGELDKFVNRRSLAYAEKMVDGMMGLTDKERKDKIFWSVMSRDDRWLKKIWE